jgi:hypothetical protein
MRNVRTFCLVRLAGRVRGGAAGWPLALAPKGADTLGREPQQQYTQVTAVSRGWLEKEKLLPSSCSLQGGGARW